jgi:hypothetical protein
MSKRLVIELSRKELAAVSYCPGYEVMGDPDADWIQEVLIPAAARIAQRKAKPIFNLPITFWIAIRGTARHNAEIFLFITPARPGARIEQALKKALLPLKEGNLCLGEEFIPDYAVPCCQVFRGKIILFYTFLEQCKGVFITTIYWKNKAPKLIFLEVSEDFVDVKDVNATHLLIRAEISPVLNGQYFRGYQQNIIPIAREDVKQSSKDKHKKP